MGRGHEMVCSWGCVFHVREDVFQRGVGTCVCYDCSAVVVVCTFCLDHTMFDDVVSVDVVAVCDGADYCGFLLSLICTPIRRSIL